MEALIFLIVIVLIVGKFLLIAAGVTLLIYFIAKAFDSPNIVINVNQNVQQPPSSYPLNYRPPLQASYQQPLRQPQPREPQRPGRERADPPKLRETIEPPTIDHVPYYSPPRLPSA